MILVEKEVPIRILEPVFQVNAAPPAQFIHPADIEDLPWRSIRLAGVEPELAFKAHDIGNHLGQVPDGDI